MLASGEAAGRIRAYAELLLAWNARINLIGRAETAQVMARHVEDSLAALALLPAGACRLADIGAGGGLPGLPLAIATGAETHLVDRDQRKCAFLREALRTTGARGVVHAADFARLPPLGADVVLSRATAALPVLLAAAWRHGRRGSVMVFHKSAAQEAEIEAARATWRFAVQVLPGGADPRGRLWRIAGLEPRDG